MSDRAVTVDDPSRKETAAWKQLVAKYQQPSVWRSLWQIGFHHIHHLSPRIPNYLLEKCHKAEPLFQSVKPVTLSVSLRSFAFRLWDEQRHKLVGFRALKALRIERTPASLRHEPNAAERRHSGLGPH